MSDITAIASGALSAFALKQSVTASNITKVNTTDSAASTAVMQSIAGGGVTAQVTTGNDKVDLSKEAVDLSLNGSAFKANIKVLQTADEMDKTLFSIKA
jgi:flagellar basal body rod protein FlgC